MIGMNNYPPYYYNRPQIQPPIFEQAQLKGRPVSSVEEVRATSIDFDGSIFYFPDLANKRIYTKQINMDGTSTVNMYELKPIPTQQQQQYVTREEFENTLLALQQKIAATQVQSAPQVAQSAPQTPVPVPQEQPKTPPQTQLPANLKF